MQLLEQTLDEEKETDQKLTDMASEINVRAMGEGSEEGSEEGEEEAPARKKAKTARA